MGACMNGTAFKGRDSMMVMMMTTMIETLVGRLSE